MVLLNHEYDLITADEYCTIYIFLILNFITILVTYTCSLFERYAFLHEVLIHYFLVTVKLPNMDSINH